MLASNAADRGFECQLGKPNIIVDYILAYVWNIQFLNHVNIKTNVNLHHTDVIADVDYPADVLCFTFTQFLKILFRSPICWPWAYTVPGTACCGIYLLLFIYVFLAIWKEPN